MPRKSISRIPATPRSIREIKPKRQQHRTIATQHDGQSSTAISMSSEPHVNTTRHRFHKSDDDEAQAPIVNDQCKQYESKEKRSKICEQWERYKRTPMRKKIRQLLWSLILYHSLRIIYTVDLEFSTSSDGVVVKPVSDSSLMGGFDFPEASSDGVTGYDFLGNPIHVGHSGRLNLVGSTEKHHGLGTTIKLGGNYEKYGIDGNLIDSSVGSDKKVYGGAIQSYDFLGNPIFDSASSVTSKSGSDASKLLGLNDMGDSNDKFMSPFNNLSSQTESLGAADHAGLSSSNSVGSSYGSNLRSSQSRTGLAEVFSSKSDELTAFERSNSLRNIADVPKTSASDADFLSPHHDNPKSSLVDEGFLSNTAKHTLDGSDDLSSRIKSESSLANPFRLAEELLESLNVRGNGLYDSSSLTSLNLVPSNNLIMSSTNYYPVSKLNCEANGGPSQQDTNEVVYWRDIPSDTVFMSPFYSPKSQEQSRDGSNNFWKTKYLTFEMDGSGFNNMRLGFENVMIMAHAMGRTLVMPPRRQLTHGLRDANGRKVVSFSDFYDIAAINANQRGLNIISMEQFLEREALNGNLKDQYPPENRIKWDNQRLDPLWAYIANVSETFDFHPNECLLVFPREGSDRQDLLKMMDDVLNENDGRKFPQPSEYQGRPTRVDAPAIERLREALGGRKKICIYDKKVHMQHDVVHFKADETDGTRLITQFYAFLWFEDWRQDLWAKRFVRDHLRYRDEIICLSARVVTALRAHARLNPVNVDGEYDAIHIRRTDFQAQFPETDLSAAEILQQIQQTVKIGSTLFVATDERNRTFFQDIEAVYDVKYLGDFASEISSINPNYFSLVEQVVASRSRQFIGTYYSSFSAFIVRMRGYFSVNEKKEGYQSGALRDTHYIPSKYKNAMRIYQAVTPPFYARDFPSAWRDIDHLDLQQRSAF